MEPTDSRTIVENVFWYLKHYLLIFVCQHGVFLGNEMTGTN